MDCLRPRRDAGDRRERPRDRFVHVCAGITPFPCTLNRVDPLRRSYSPIIPNAFAPVLSDDGAHVLCLSIIDSLPQARFAGTTTSPRIAGLSAVTKLLSIR